MRCSLLLGEGARVGEGADTEVCAPGRADAAKRDGSSSLATLARVSRRARGEHSREEPRSAGRGSEWLWVAQNCNTEPLFGQRAGESMCTTSERWASVACSRPSPPPRIGTDSVY